MTMITVLIPDEIHRECKSQCINMTNVCVQALKAATTRAEEPIERSDFEINRANSEDTYQKWLSEQNIDEDRKTDQILSQLQDSYNVLIESGKSRDDPEVIALRERMKNAKEKTDRPV